jgi:DNA-binding NarL/FixJ family response regulator
MTQIEIHRGGDAVVVVDGMSLRRAGLVQLLDGWARANGVSVVGTGDFSFVYADRLACRLLLLNLGGTAASEPQSAELLRELIRQNPDVPVVVFADDDAPENVISAFRVGARGYIPTLMQPDLVLQALTFIIAGGSFFPPEVLLNMQPESARRSTGLAERGDPVDGVVAALTNRQMEVLALLRRGASNKLIARELRMCESTVKVHVRQIMQKLGVANRTQAALM